MSDDITKLTDSHLLTYLSIGMKITVV